MDNPLLGIHHVTAIAGDVQHNLDFYAGVLGLRLVKRTVNFDDPGTYHLYYGNEAGDPGTILTFFPWPHAPHGRPGTGQVTVTTLSVPEGSLPYWTERLRQNGVALRGTGTRFGEPFLAFVDPDGMPLELAAVAKTEGHAVQGIHSVTLSEEGYERTAALLTGALGFTLAAEEGNRFRYKLPGDASGALVDVLCRPEAPRGQIAVGSVHHVAWRVAGDEGQRSWRSAIADLGLNVSPVLDRQYFRSIYFREPGGVLFEIATDPPGFTADEPLEALGAGLMLPPWLEPQRHILEHILTPIHLPGEGSGS